MPDDEITQRDRKLIQWLGEAYAKEAELEADLTAHIALTKKDTYKKRLRQHLSETKDHKKQVAARIKKLGGKPEAAQSVPGVPSAMGEVAGKAVAAVKGQVGTVRAAVTNQVETHLRNAQEELREEHVEIALYRRIETFATEVGDRDTAQLAKRIIREEERMAKYLDAELTRLVKEFVRAEVPRAERTTARTTARRRTTSASRSTRRTGSTSTRSASSRSRSSGSSSNGRSESGTSSRTGTSARSGASSRGGTRSRSASRGS